MIIDFHTHLFPDRIAEKTVRALEATGGVPAFSDGTARGLAEALSGAGGGIAVNLPVLTRPTQFSSVLDFVKELNRQHRECGSPIISFAGAHPEMDDIEEALSAVKAAGILGIKIHPDYQGKFFDDEGYIRILRAAKELDLITVTHSGVDVAYTDAPVRCTPERVLRVLDKIGGYPKLVLAHYGASEMHGEVYSLLAGEDVYFDTANVLSSISERDFMRILEKHGDDRILFASDSPWQDISENLKRLTELPLGEASLKKILYKNAEGLLGISL